MNINEVSAIFERKKINTYIYEILERKVGAVDQIGVMKTPKGFTVYFVERGTVIDDRDFNTEAEASDYLLREMAKGNKRLEQYISKEM